MTVALASPSPLRDGEVTLELVDARVPALLLAASRDPEITRWTQVPGDLSVSDAALVTAGWASSRTIVRLQVCLPDLAPAGMVTVWVNGDGDAEVGYWLLSEARGRGVARRAVAMLCAWAFDACGVARLVLTTLPGNVASELVAAACGFARVGETSRDVKGVVRELALWELRGDRPTGAAGQRAAIAT